MSPAQNHNCDTSRQIEGVENMKNRPPGISDGPCGHHGNSSLSRWSLECRQRPKHSRVQCRRQPGPGNAFGRERGDEAVQGRHPGGHHGQLYQQFALVVLPERGQPHFIAERGCSRAGSDGDDPAEWGFAPANGSGSQPACSSDGPGPGAPVCQPTGPSAGSGHGRTVLLCAIATGSFISLRRGAKLSGLRSLLLRSLLLPLVSLRRAGGLWFWLWGRTLGRRWSFRGRGRR